MCSRIEYGSYLFSIFTESYHTKHLRGPRVPFPDTLDKSSPQRHHKRRPHAVVYTVLLHLSVHGNPTQSQRGRKSLKIFHSDQRRRCYVIRTGKRLPGNLVTRTLVKTQRVVESKRWEGKECRYLESTHIPNLFHDRLEFSTSLIKTNDGVLESHHRTYSRVP